MYEGIGGGGINWETATVRSAPKATKKPKKKHQVTVGHLALAKEMNDRELTASDVGELCNLSVNTIHHWFGGYHHPNEVARKILQSELGVYPNDWDKPANPYELKRELADISTRAHARGVVARAKAGPKCTYFTSKGAEVFASWARTYPGGFQALVKRVGCEAATLGGWVIGQRPTIDMRFAIEEISGGVVAAELWTIPITEH